MPRFTPLDLKCVLEYAVVGEGLCDVTESIDALLLKGCMPTFWGHLVRFISPNVKGATEHFSRRL